MAVVSEAKRAAELVVEQILPEVRKGRMVILIDDADRENEGDLFVAAERATPEAISFMANHARGLVSLALTETRMRELGLLKGTPMTQATREQFPDVPLSRIPGAPEGLELREVAGTILTNLLNPTHALNGVMLRLDAGEQ